MAERSPHNRMHELLQQFKALYDGRIEKIRSKVDASDTGRAAESYEVIIS